MGKHDAVGSVYIKGLAFLVGTGAALRGITDVPDTDVAGEIPHVAGAEDVAHQAHRLIGVKREAVQRTDPRGILTAVLQKQQRIIETLVNRFLTDQADNTAHVEFSRIM